MGGDGLITFSLQVDGKRVKPTKAVKGAVNACTAVQLSGEIKRAVSVLIWNGSFGHKELTIMKRSRRLLLTYRPPPTMPLKLATPRGRRKILLRTQTRSFL